MIDNKTTNYNFPLPNAENTLLDDCDRISSAISKIDNEINNLNNVVNTKIDNEINNLNNVVNTKLTAGSLKTINKQSIIGDGNIEIQQKAVTISGDVAMYATQSKIYKITNYNSFSRYEVLADVGTATINEDTITYNSILNSPSAVVLSVSCDGVISQFTLTINQSGVQTPTIISPSVNAVDQNKRVLVQLSDFQSFGNNDELQTATWQLSTDADFSTLLVNDTNSATSYTFSDLTISTLYYYRAKFSGHTNGDSEWVKGQFTTKNRFYELYQLIGTAGSQGFGVGALNELQAAEVASWITPMQGATDPTSDNYGNYTTTNGSIMVCIPKFYYRRGNENSPLYEKYGKNCLDIVGIEMFNTEAEANASGYALPRAFIDNGEEKDYFFIDKYKCSKDGNNSCKSIANVNPISLLQTSSGGWTKSQGMTNCTGILADAITLSRARGDGRFQCQSVFMNAALQMLIDAHAQAATSTAYCAWYDSNGVKNYPKGCNNNALADVDDTTVTYAQGDNGGSSYKKPKTRATANFAKTTHNGQACGVADLNGMLYEVLIGVTNIGANDTATNQIQNATAYVLKRSAKLADLTSGWNGETDAWGTAEKLATRYDLVNDFFIGTNGALSGRVGNGTNQVFSEVIDNTDTEYLRANCGYVKDANSISSNGSNMYGADYYYEYNRENLVVLGSSYWGGSTNAGAFYRNYNYRSNNSGNFGFRASAYN